MNSYKMIFTLREKIENDEEASDLIWWYLGSLDHNGQVLKNYELIKNKNDYHAYLTLPEDDSADEKYNSVYAADFLIKIKKLFDISIEIIGKNLSAGESCLCTEKPSWYMLYTDYSDGESPVVCGSCDRSVPLYKMPYSEMHEDHFHVSSWKNAYHYVDRLFMNCLADRFTYRQLNNVNSQLSKQGIAICREFEKLTGVPFYYYLYHYNYKKTPENCPVCGESWKIESDKTFVDYKCEKCRLVADKV